MDNHKNEVFDMVKLMRVEELNLRKLGDSHALLVRALWDRLFAFIDPKDAPHGELIEMLTGIGVDGADTFADSDIEKLRGKIRAAVRAEEFEDGEVSRRNLNGCITLMDEQEATRKLRVLCVDDAALILETLASILSKDYEVFSLVKGSHVEKFLNNNTPEMFVLDYSMPDIMGLDLVPIIRKHPEHKETPIMILTALGTAERVKDSLKLGVCDFMIKPVKPDILKAKIKKHIQRKKTF